MACSFPPSCAKCSTMPMNDNPNPVHDMLSVFRETRTRLTHQRHHHQNRTPSLHWFPQLHLEGWSYPMPESPRVQLRKYSESGDGLASSLEDIRLIIRISRALSFFGRFKMNRREDRFSSKRMGACRKSERHCKRQSVERWKRQHHKNLVGYSRRRGRCHVSCNCPGPIDGRTSARADGHP